MKRLVFVTALIVAALFHRAAHADADPPVECFASPEAVHEAHPGSHAVYTTHATWWTESSKCWFAGKPAATPKTKPRAAVAQVQSQYMTQALPTKPKQQAKAAHDEKPAVIAVTYDEDAAALRAPNPRQQMKPAHEERAEATVGTFEENAAALRALLAGYTPSFRALMFADESQTDFKGRFSVVGYRMPK
jgi:hypothetical protein